MAARLHRHVFGPVSWKHLCWLFIQEGELGLQVIMEFVALQRDGLIVVLVFSMICSGASNFTVRTASIVVLVFSMISSGGL